MPFSSLSTASFLLSLPSLDVYKRQGEVNEVTGKGRHTTVARELVLLKHGGLLIDNPGIREIQLWTDEHTLRESFADLTELAQMCIRDSFCTFLGIPLSHYYKICIIHNNNQNLEVLTLDCSSEKLLENNLTPRTRCV